MFEKAISLMQPNSEKMFSIFSKYGYSSLNNHYYMDAISAYQKAYQCDSTYTDALLFIAYSYEKLNNYTSSLSFYNQFLAKEDKLSEEKRDYVQSRIYHVKEEIFMAEN
jgi:tetratricopeptide (TPR) repeat protein